MISSPLDMNELDESVFDGIAGNKVAGKLQCLYNDTEMALSDIWDRSDDGFQAQQEVLHELAELLGFELEPYEPEEEDGND